MPTYVYECKSCRETFEVEQRITENALTKCILCEIGEVKRVIQPIGVVFKGSGFHINDYASAGAPAAKSEPSTAEASPSSSSTPATPEASAPAAAPAAPTKE